jgi:uncharacterized protein YbcI
VAEEPTTVTTESRGQSPAAILANRLVRLIAKYLGRGPTKARTTLNTNVAVVVFADTLTRAERNLTLAGESDTFRRMRQTLQRSMRDEAVAAVEETLGRRVIAYMGDVDTEANVAALLFTLDPQAESGRADVVEVHSPS